MQLPVWIRPHIKSYDVFGEMMGEVSKFFKNIGSTMEKIVQKPSRSHQPIAYEVENSVNNLIHDPLVIVPKTLMNISSQYQTKTFKRHHSKENVNDPLMLPFAKTKSYESTMQPVQQWLDNIPNPKQSTALDQFQEDPLLTDYSLTNGQVIQSEVSHAKSSQVQLDPLAITPVAEEQKRDPLLVTKIENLNDASVQFDPLAVTERIIKLSTNLEPTRVKHKHPNVLKTECTNAGEKRSIPNHHDVPLKETKHQSSSSKRIKKSNSDTQLFLIKLKLKLHRSKYTEFRELLSQYKRHEIKMKLLIEKVSELLIGKDMVTLSQTQQLERVDMFKEFKKFVGSTHASLIDDILASRKLFC
ncbi:hypothetical protein BC833DRAFT_289459 [Globomyces pollinis-pini]|nr:hypothetical protein BC833DRAFT_289459 [Globomyces pollinis-pini]